MRWLLVDGNGFAYRYASVENRGKYIYNRFTTLQDSFKPSLIIVAWDSPESVRRETYPLYKADRPEKPPEVLEAFQTTKDVCRDLELPSIEVDGYEADDVLATCCSLAKELGHQSILYSIDKDLRQLLCKDWITQLCKTSMRYGDNEYDWMTADKLQKKTGLMPFQWIDYMALVGGKNNIPSVNGCGPQRATKLLTSYLSIDEFVKDPCPKRSGLSKNLCEYIVDRIDSISQWRELHTLNRALEIDVPCLNDQINAFWSNNNE